VRGSGRLVFRVHSLVADDASWQTLLGELDAALTALASGITPEPGPAPAPFATWSAPTREPGTHTRTRTRHLATGPALDTLRRVADRFHADPVDVALTGLALALDTPHAVDVTRSGRGERHRTTVGRFTVWHRVTLGAETEADHGALLKHVKERLRTDAAQDAEDTPVLGVRVLPGTPESPVLAVELSGPDGPLDALADTWPRALRTLAALDRPGQGGHTPSDFSLVALDQGALAALETRWAARRPTGTTGTSN
ncbi:hypothetical protein ACFP1Z_22735, partial [Streptomyces gamaensis]